MLALASADGYNQWSSSWETLEPMSSSLPDGVIFMMVRNPDSQSTSAWWNPEWIAQCAADPKLFEITVGVIDGMVSSLQSTIERGGYGKEAN